MSSDFFYARDRVATPFLFELDVGPIFSARTNPTHNINDPTRLVRIWSTHFCTAFQSSQKSQNELKTEQSPTCSQPGVRKFDCTFLTYLSYRLAMLVPLSEWPLKTTAVRIFAYVRPYTTCKVTKRSRRLLDQVREFLSDVEECSSILRQQLALRYSHRMLKCQRTEWRRGVSIFPDTCHKSVTTATSFERAIAISVYYYKAHNLVYTCWKFGKHQSRNSGENNANVRIFTCAPNHPLQIIHKISEVAGP